MSSPSTPGPKPAPFVGNLLQFAAGPLDFLTQNAREHGDFVLWNDHHGSIYQLNHPALIEQVLLRHRDTTHKDPITTALNRIMGDGLLTAEGEAWKRHRKFASPAFRPKQIRAYAQTMVQSAIEDVPAPGPIDATEWMSRITLHIVLRTIFGSEPGGRAHDAIRLTDDIMEDFDTEYHTAWRLIPEWIPSPHRLRFGRAARELDTILRGVIRDRASAGEGNDLLWSLLQARTEDGDALTETELRDDAITLFLAGHETTALTLAYSLWLLAEHPDWQERLFRELSDLDGGRDPGFADLGQLPVLGSIVDESMRLYPPAWTIGRQALVDLDLDGQKIPAKSTILMPQWVVHRDARWFPEPDRFRPDRWTSGETEDLHRFAFFPFGGGARVCIGNHFARMESLLALAALVRRYRFSPQPGFQPQLFASVTLRSSNGIHIRFEPREMDEA